MSIIILTISTPKMACSGEPVEVAVLKDNLVFITDAITQNLQWFADCLVEKAFISSGSAHEILCTHEDTPALQAGRLMDSFFARISVSDEKRKLFEEFVNIFSRKTPYNDLVEKLMREGMEYKIYSVRKFTSIYSHWPNPHTSI